MIIGIAGAAGSGKDTVADFIGKYNNSICIAQADPMKRFARDVFGFTEEQLWGPSECRNAPDARYDTSPAWSVASGKLHAFGPKWIDEVLPDLDVDARFDAFGALVDWFIALAKTHGFEPDKTEAPFVLNLDMKPSLESLFPAFAKRQLTPRYVLQTIGTEWGRQFSPDMWNNVARRTARKLLAGGPRYNRATGLTDDIGYHGPEFVCVTDIRFRNELLGVHEDGGIVLNVQSPSENNTAVEAAGVAGHKSEAELKGIPSHWYDYVIVNNKARGLLALENVIHTLTNELKASPRMYSTEYDGPTDEAWEAHY